MDELYLKEKEIWKDIPGFEGIYQASTFGRIRSLDAIKKYVNFKGTTCNQKKFGKILKPYPQSGGYMTVTLYKNGTFENWFVHRLVALTFLENPKNGKKVSFKDGNKYNIALENLFWEKRK